MPRLPVPVLALAVLAPACGRHSDADRSVPSSSSPAPEPKRTTPKRSEDAAASASTEPSGAAAKPATASGSTAEPSERSEESWVFTLHDLERFRSRPTPVRFTKPSTATNGLAIFEYRLSEIGAVTHRFGQQGRWDLTIHDKSIDAFGTNEPPRPLSGPDKERWWLIRSGLFADAFVRQRGKELALMSPVLACPPSVRTEEFDEACRRAGQPHD